MSGFFTGSARQPRPPRRPNGTCDTTSRRRYQPRRPGECRLFSSARAILARCLPVNAKDNPDPGKPENFLKLWTLDGLVDASGKELVCAPPEEGPFADSREFEKQPPASCETYRKPDFFTFGYLGLGSVADCTDNAAPRANQKPPTAAAIWPKVPR